MIVEIKNKLYLFYDNEKSCKIYINHACWHRCLCLCGLIEKMSYTMYSETPINRPPLD